MYSILVAAGKTATTWSERGIALGGKGNIPLNNATVFQYLPVIFFVTFLHGLTPRTGVCVMNVRSTSNPLSTS